MAANALLYLLLIFAHIMNDDFGKETFVKPSIVDDTKRPYYLWSTVTAVYEFALPTSLTVMLVFSCLEFPWMINRG